MQQKFTVLRPAIYFERVEVLAESPEEAFNIAYNDFCKTEMLEKEYSEVMSPDEHTWFVTTPDNKIIDFKGRPENHY